MFGVSFNAMIRATIAAVGLLTFTSGCGDREDKTPRDRIDYSFFIDQIENRDDVTKEMGSTNVLYVEIGEHEILGEFVEPPIMRPSTRPA